VMVNCNPETVSTDYDTADRLYFEPLTFEDVMAIVERERSAGGEVACVVQFGGQTPLKLALPLLAPACHPRHLARLDRPGRGPRAVLAAAVGPRHPAAAERHGVSREEAREVAERIGFPVVVRPSYVLGGRGMAIVFDAGALDRYMTGAVDVSHDGRC
jgi:carbamoyl-phosphate synthase large subunit